MLRSGRGRRRSPAGWDPPGGWPGASLGTRPAGVGGAVRRRRGYPS
ncbi:hypothetical protein ACFSM7_02665 [Clavibacter michiganensis subsp. tessellarius]